MLTFEGGGVWYNDHLVLTFIPNLGLPAKLLKILDIAIMIYVNNHINKCIWFIDMI